MHPANLYLQALLHQKVFQQRWAKHPVRVNILKTEINHRFPLLCFLPASFWLFWVFLVELKLYPAIMWNPWLMWGDTSISPSYRNTSGRGAFRRLLALKVSLGSMSEVWRERVALPHRSSHFMLCQSLLCQTPCLTLPMLETAASSRQPVSVRLCYHLQVPHLRLCMGEGTETWQYWEWDNLLKLATFSLLF